MAADQKNFGLFTYVDDFGVSWNKRGEKDAVRNAVDGSSAFGANPYWTESARHKVRTGLYQDPTTFRTKSIIIYTAAAAAALTPGTDTLAFHVEGETGTVSYTYAGLVAERQPKVKAVNNLADHA